LVARLDGTRYVFDWHVRVKWTIVSSVMRQLLEGAGLLSRWVTGMVLPSVMVILDPSAALPLLVPPASTSWRPS